MTGTIVERYGQRTLRLAVAADLADLGDGGPVAPSDLAPSDALEVHEGSLVRVSGTIAGSPDALSDGYAVDLERQEADPLRVVVAGLAAIDPARLAPGASVRLTGALGQRDASGSGSTGYRLHLRSAADIEPLVKPTPAPTATAAPSATPIPTTIPTPSAPTPTPAMTPLPTPTPVAARPPPRRRRPHPDTHLTPTPGVDGSILAARLLPVGTHVTVTGTVTAERGRLLDERVIVIQGVRAPASPSASPAAWTATRSAAGVSSV